MKRREVAIIGGGIGGMVAGAMLARSGERVTVYEKEPVLGGCLAEFRRGSFIFDISLHMLNGCNDGGYVRDVFARCGIDGAVSFVRPQSLYRAIFPDFELRVPQADYEGYERRLSELFPGSRAGIASLFARVKDALGRVPTSVGQRGAFFDRKLLSLMRQDCASFIREHLEDPRAIAAVSQLWIYCGLPPSMLRAIDFFYPWFDYAHNGGSYLTGGGYAIIDALAKVIRAHGGECLVRSPVERIVVSGGLASAVVVGGHERRADVVISGIDIGSTARDLAGAGHFSRRFMTRTAGIVPSISAFEIFLGVDADLKKAYPGEYEIFVNACCDPDRQYADSLENRALTASFVITINSNVNGRAAPAGKSAVTLIMLSGHASWREVSLAAYDDMKSAVAAVLMERAAAVIPELKTAAIEKVVSTPKTFERYTGNAGGAIYGYAATAGERLEFRPNEMRDIKNLYFASMWARQGSGVVKVVRAADDVAAKIARSREATASYA